MSDATSPARRKWPVLRFFWKRIRHWLERHQHPFNFWLHMLGIPLAVTGVFLLFLLPWYWGVGGLVVGYFLQWVGHQVEGNDLGEWAAIKGMLGLPYVAISPRYQPFPASSQPAR